MDSRLVEPELIADYQCVIGENPLWHPAEQRLYWIDINTGRLFRFDPASAHHEQCYSGEVMGGFTIQADGTLLLFTTRGVVRLWREGHAAAVIASIPDEIDTRFNDVIADPAGRVFCGTVSADYSIGRLYRLDPDGHATRILDGIACPNGMGFTADRRVMYYTASITREIYACDYDVTTGAIANRRLFAPVPADGGMPDGLTVDSEGGVWSARWGGGCVVRYSPDGRELSRILFPTERVSSVTFGGPDYADLYVTTAGGHEKGLLGPSAGALFRVRPGVRGLPEFSSRIKDAPPE